MNEDKKSYRSIMKATSLFGGVQFFNIIIAIIRSKIIAILLGPGGMGIAGLLSSSLGLISSLTNFGLGTSAVRDIAAAYETGNQNRISKVSSIFRRLVWLTGLLGAILTLIFAQTLSNLTFGNTEYTMAFMWLSCTLLLNQLTSGQGVLLQGTRKLKYLAKANMVGSLIGLLITVPLYYYYGIDGIVPAMIMASISSLIITWYFSRKIDIKKIAVTREETILEGKGMLKMGFMLSLSGLITMAASYIVRVFISNTGGIDDVGLYNAGFTIIGTYVGLIFSAMATDYYPKLSGVANDNQKATLLINQQAEIGILILAPILTVFLIFINWVIVILYSTKFVEVSDMVHWSALGMYFKVASWSIGFILLAKGASTVFFWSELLANIYIVLFNLIGYNYLGLDGLGISFLVSYICSLIQIYFIANYKYKFTFNLVFYKIFSFQLILGIISFLIIKLTPTPWAYIIGLPFIFVSCWYSFKELDNRLNLKEIISKFRKK
ncbi:O-antigen translocase [Flavivirga abyssicola]|uniref:O-antigen translocase n=1 Tax=Flavivirga abyssicola TaxID=3063533 RepID=UPI0026DFD9DD|nr:O-antigen translocase [Flavivirga sp. MEBiC07777]WVK12980.1 O-antigen translocase [Flavivirga sp. MEBiC07777]